ncbi:hypothetical protein F5B22DRAFT_610206 [Xylaria bambusicola]|uniref:uncharacterized protein n=1 Tax=Xylaria bambusicola TaxID=326684 RepID=UPI002008EA40|nr:uncharacterized protein F5B22DRAFT_610206 [Xylaria bambusicola]KAI0514625.1 hypothetical protein F5B22DRAFT_610206 [Xylaria bambusicola]
MDLNDKPSNDKSEPKPKMLPDSRWAKEHLISTHTPPLSTKPNTNRNTPPQPRTQTSKQRRRGNRGPVRPKKENDDPHREYTMRVNMDMDEFQREVEELGLKTLKDSRWA